MADYRIYCCTHVPTTTIDDRVYTLIQTGRAFDGYTIDGMLGDNTGDNISRRKDSFDGMLTAMYWIWKNTCHDITGTCTYRRYLATNDYQPFRLEDIQYVFEECKADFLVSVSSSPSTLSTFSIGESLKSTATRSMYYNYLFNPWTLLREVFAKYYDSYLNAFDCVTNGYTANYGVIFAARNTYFNSLCEWLFGVLEKYEALLRLRGYPYPYNFCRIFGAITERILRVWLLMQHIKIIETKTCYVNIRDIGDKNCSFAGRETLDVKTCFEYGVENLLLYSAIY